MKTKKDKALVLLSGGQDSTTCLYWAKKYFDEVHAVAFSYGQKHELEVKIARNIAEKANIHFSVIDVDSLKTITHNALTDKSIPMDEEKPKNALPNTFVPGRNLIFLTYAAIYAYSLHIHHLVTGVSEADYSGYPDCRKSFIESANLTLNEAMDYDFKIHTPLMYLNKEKVWQLADELSIFDIIREQTLTCYNGIIADGCGNCPACRLRNNGLENYLKNRTIDCN